MNSIQEAMTLEIKTKSKYKRPQLDVFLSQHQLTQKEFADMLGVAASTVNNWLQTNSVPDSLTVDLIREKFNLSRDAFWHLFKPSNNN